MAGSPENTKPEVNDPKLDQPLSDKEKVELTEQAQAWVALTSGTYANS